MNLFEFQRQAIVDRLRWADRPAVSPMAVVLHTNLERQNEYADVALPGHAVKLVDVAEAAGWGVRTGWSSIAIPQGHRWSNHHGAAKEARIMKVLGVQCVIPGERISILWHVPGGAQVGFHVRRGVSTPIGCEGAIGYLREGVS